MGPAWFNTIFELTPQGGGGWEFSTQFNFQPYNESQPNPLTIDASGKIYGTLMSAGGVIYNLTSSGSGWNYSNLYTFGYGNQNQGYSTVGTIVIDPAGSIYGENQYGDQPPYGTVWEFTPR